MKAAVTMAPGASPFESIVIKEVPMPKVKPGWVLIQVKAFGLNRSELFTRRGDSPNVVFPRVQGIECVGLVAQDGTGKFSVGTQVAAIMGEMGRAFDGGYAEYTLVPEKCVFSFSSHLPWEVLGAIPEMCQTTSGSLNEALEIKAGEVLLIRGGTSSIGMMATQLAKARGLTVVATTRNKQKVSALKANGCDAIIIDNGTIEPAVRRLYPNGVNKVLELVGTTTLLDSLKCVAPKGMVCMTGILGNAWTMENFSPMGDIPALVRLTVYMGDTHNFSSQLLQEFVDLVAAEKLHLNIDRVFNLNQVPEAQDYMEKNLAKGKVVVRI